MKKFIIEKLNNIINNLKFIKINIIIIKINKMKKILLFLTLIIIIQCQNRLLEEDSDSCEILEYKINGTCRRCDMEDHCIECDFENNTCLLCALPYKLDGKRCKLSSKTITWIILMYLLIIVIVTVLIVVLVLPKLN